jgi:hypothetical protein
MTEKRKIRIVLEVDGGIVQGVWADADVEVLLYDFDNIKDDPKESGVATWEPKETVVALDRVIRNLNRRVSGIQSEAKS